MNSMRAKYSVSDALREDVQVHTVCVGEQYYCEMLIRGETAASDRDRVGDRMAIAGAMVELV